MCNVHSKHCCSYNVVHLGSCCRWYCAIQSEQNYLRGTIGPLQHLKLRNFSGRCPYPTNRFVPLTPTMGHPQTPSRTGCQQPTTGLIQLMFIAGYEAFVCVCFFLYKTLCAAFHTASVGRPYQAVCVFILRENVFT